MTRKTSVQELLSVLGAPFVPLELGAFNDHAAYILHCKGDFGMHSHAEDEFYFVLEGEVTIRFKNAPEEILRKGDSLTVPAYVTHSPDSAEGAQVMMIKRKGTFIRPQEVE